MRSQRHWGRQRALAPRSTRERYQDARDVIQVLVIESWLPGLLCEDLAGVVRIDLGIT